MNKKLTLLTHSYPRPNTSFTTRQASVDMQNLLFVALMSGLITLLLGVLN